MGITFNLTDNKVPAWAVPSEFANGKKIAILNFERLSKDQTTAKYLDNEGKTYRLTFLDLDNDSKKRHLEVYARGFKDDLASCVIREFKSDSIPTGHPVLLKHYKEERLGRDENGDANVKLINRWDLRKIDEPITTQYERDIRED